MSDDTALALVPRKTSLGEAASMLTALCDQIDAMAEEQSANKRLAAIDSALVRAFEDTRLELADAVDRRIGFDVWAKAALVAARAARKEWNDRVQLLKALHERFRERTRDVVAANPNISYAGRLGRLAVQKNAPKVVLVFGDKSVTADMVRFLGIEPEYLRVTYAINLEAVEVAIKAGKTLSWAALKTDGSHLRIRK